MTTQPELRTLTVGTYPSRIDFENMILEAKNVKRNKRYQTNRARKVLTKQLIPAANRMLALHSHGSSITDQISLGLHHESVITTEFVESLTNDLNTHLDGLSLHEDGTSRDAVAEVLTESRLIIGPTPDRETRAQELFIALVVTG